MGSYFWQKFYVKNLLYGGKSYKYGSITRYVCTLSRYKPFPDPLKVNLQL